MLRSWPPGCVALGLLLGACGGSDAATKTTAVVIDAEDLRQPISGFGASSAWTAPSLSEELADQLFSPELGIGLSFLRVRITPNGTSDELPTARQALARGARVWAAPWSPPGEWKVDTRTNPLYGGRLLPEHYPDWADSLAGFVESAAAEGVPLHGLSVQNEPGYVNNWETCEWTPAELAGFTRDHLIPALRRRGLETPLIAPESNSWGRLAEYAEPLLEDADTRDAVGFVASHAYGNASPYKYAAASEYGKELWQTEVSEAYSDGPDPGIDSGLWVARMMHDALGVAEVSAWHYWWLLPRGDVPEQGNSALLLNGALTRRAYVMGNYSRFVRPGSVRLGTSSANPQPGVFLTAFRDDAATTLTVVALNLSSAPALQRFELSGVTSSEIVPWVTDETRALAAQPALTGGSSFEYELPARSVTSLVASLVP